MGKLLPFDPRKRRSKWAQAKSYGADKAKTPRAPRPLAQRLARSRPFVLGAVLLALGMWDGYRGGASAQWSFLPWVPRPSATDPEAAWFPLCGMGQRYNCVIDGDTFWYRGDKIRVLGIDAPEVSEPQCRREAELGERATHAFRDLLNAGPFTLRRDPLEPLSDRYGRRLRYVSREGQDLGEAMIQLGLAYHYRAAAPDWCD